MPLLDIFADSARVGARPWHAPRMRHPHWRSLHHVNGVHRPRKEVALPPPFIYKPPRLQPLGLHPGRRYVRCAARRGRRVSSDS